MFKKMIVSTLATGLLFSVSGNAFAESPDYDSVKYEINAAVKASEFKDIAKMPIDMKKVTSTDPYNLDKKNGRVHKGFDFAAPQGTRIDAVQSGKVVFADFGSKKNGFTDYGNVVVIEHTYNKKKLYTLYAHMSKMSVKKGDTVEASQKIGEVGKTGEATGNHLHLEVRTDTLHGERVDPTKYLPPFKK
ncbi:MULTISPECIES: M23 family metallopeptidase [Bacillus]|uniref:M23 family metallopeptidase n=2 Tax=Bacillaceae TaxID=186817 RepID=UPI000B4A5B19|nr:M23 family metallopeptidase [Bacillus thuringiensis]MDA2213829.1 M23 family metallopeptidase [Bacillus cereus]MDA2225260.1 M23 family metallopeptidase [Bacillus cereus]MDA2463966.1 M23 family metallopeptidase [Bacillus cereus]PDZ93358.1 M23 family peptidase [Bacillus thuringiensis]PGL50332.1 M23 family peptidase [Bacillus thuringiensis]